MVYVIVLGCIVVFCGLCFYVAMQAGTLEDMTDTVAHAR